MSSSNLAATTIAPGAMYVRALYDYDADDRTSLSFRAGDIIQVITQLESGWWDGVIHGVRGWFPSNYCAVVPGPGEDTADIGGHGTEEEEESEDEFGGPGMPSGRDYGSRPQQDGEEAAFWIPQATADGRLFYFNTLTGVSTMELPLETPSSANETGPRDRTNVYIPDHTRPPAELLVQGYERNEETDYESTSEADYNPMSASNHSLVSTLPGCQEVFNHNLNPAPNLTFYLQSASHANVDHLACLRPRRWSH